MKDTKTNLSILQLIKIEHGAFEDARWHVAGCRGAASCWRVFAGSSSLKWEWRALKTRSPGALPRRNLSCKSNLNEKSQLRITRTILKKSNWSTKRWSCHFCFVGYICFFSFQIWAKAEDDIFSRLSVWMTSLESTLGESRLHHFGQLGARVPCQRDTYSNTTSSTSSVFAVALNPWVASCSNSLRSWYAIFVCHHNSRVLSNMIQMLCLLQLWASNIVVLPTAGRIKHSAQNKQHSKKLKPHRFSPAKPVVSTHLKNSQNGNLPQKGVKKWWK